MLAIGLAGLATLAPPQDTIAPADGPIRVLREIRLAAGVRGVDGSVTVLGESAAWLGDLDGDGVGDMAVGSSTEFPGGDATGGAVRILFLDRDGTVRRIQKIADSEGGLSAPLLPYDFFGYSLTCPGDLDGDGVVDLAVGAPGDDGPDPHGEFFRQRGTVYVLFLRRDGTVRAHQKIDSQNGGLQESLDFVSRFGVSVCSPGDLDRDGTPDLAVGANAHDSRGDHAGAIFILFLDRDGSVRAEQKINETVGGFSGSITGLFGSRLVRAGDVDGDGVDDLVVEDLPVRSWLLFMNRNGTVDRNRVVAEAPATGDFGPIGSAGDLNDDGVPDLLMSFRYNTDPHGTLQILHLDRRGRVRNRSVIGENEGGFLGHPSTRFFGASASAEPGDWNGDGRPDLLVGSLGAVWILELDEGGNVAPEALFSNGNGVNRACLTSSGPPLAGGTWTASVDARPHATLAGLVATFDPLVPPVKLGMGELLIDLFHAPALFALVRPAAVGATPFDVALPRELYGKHFFVQGFVLGGAGTEVCNALELVVGN